MTRLGKERKSQFDSLQQDPNILVRRLDESRRFGDRLIDFPILLQKMAITSFPEEYCRNYDSMMTTQLIQDTDLKYTTSTWKQLFFQYRSLFLIDYWRTPVYNFREIPLVIASDLEIRTHARRTKTHHGVLQYLTRKLCV